jgi:uncharacterized protein
VASELARAWERLVRELAGLGSVLVSFSGGVDSSLLLLAARTALGGSAVPALCVGPFTPPWEEASARRLAADLEAELVEVKAGELSDPALAANDRRRCYLCKSRRLALLAGLARERGLAAVAEGSQADDAAEERPGARAVAEHGALSPLAAAGLGKAGVRALAAAWGLEAAGAPSQACLATRIPTGTPISTQALERVARAEAALRELLPGRQLRVRDHHPVARVELAPEEIAAAAAQPLRGRLAAALAAAGYGHACLDLAGYGSGRGATSPPKG